MVSNRQFEPWGMIVAEGLICFVIAIRCVEYARKWQVVAQGGTLWGSNFYCTPILPYSTSIWSNTELTSLLKSPVVIFSVSQGKANPQ